MQHSLFFLKFKFAHQFFNETPAKSYSVCSLCPAMVGIILLDSKNNSTSSNNISINDETPTRSTEVSHQLKQIHHNRFRKFPWASTNSSAPSILV
ncbi:unnamed protein product [Blepharisma stoltei]|uniref:Uncharacterized protein n=1 Tax=Blepharisma stoltei TaxID=1481888 RepID=A0AAU9KCM8_9CILI|nr:unnamed protein product [Blepharisma stoltei]